MQRLSYIFLCCLMSFPVAAETVNLQQAIEMALGADPRVKERERLVDAARALLEEVEGNKGFRYDLNAFAALTTGVEGGLYKNGATTCSGNCELRDDAYDFNDGVSLWTNLQVTIVKPLYSFGRIESYADAAEKNITVKQGDIALQRADTIIDVTRAYNGYLAARDTRLLLLDTKKRLASALELVERFLEEEKGNIKLTDKYALQSGLSLTERYLSQAEGIQKIALDGLKFLTGVGLDKPLTVADRRIRPVALPTLSLPEFKSLALENRPEMLQVKAGLAARRSLVEANRAEKKPVIYAGVAGALSYSPGRDRLDNPHIYDPFNFAAFTPLVGLQWQWQSGVQPARVKKAQAELDALIEKASLAQQGIPFQVAEQYYQVEAHYKAVKHMKESSKAARRWMIAAYTDFEAGLGEPAAILDALKAYVLAYSEYLSLVNDYNLYVAKLDKAIGVRHESIN